MNTQVLHLWPTLFYLYPPHPQRDYFKVNPDNILPTNTSFLSLKNINTTPKYSM